MCTKCGRHYGYNYVIDYDLLANRCVRRLYTIKYHLGNKIKRFNLDDTQKDILKEKISSVLFAFRQCRGERKVLIKLDFIFGKLFRLMGLPEKETMCIPVKTITTKRKYEDFCKEICRINNWEYAFY